MWIVSRLFLLTSITPPHKHLKFSSVLFGKLSAVGACSTSHSKCTVVRKHPDLRDDFPPETMLHICVRFSCWTIKHFPPRGSPGIRSQNAHSLVRYPRDLTQKVWKRLRRLHFNLHLKCFSGLRTTAKQAEYPGKRMCGCWLHLHVQQAFFGIRETRNTYSISAGWWQEKGQIHLSASGKQCHVQGRRWLGNGLRGGGEKGREPHAARGCLFSWYMAQRHQMDLTYACHQPPVASDHGGWLSTGQTSLPQPIPNDPVPETSLHPFRHFLKTMSTERIRR